MGKNTFFHFWSTVHTMSKPLTEIQLEINVMQRNDSHSTLRGTFKKYKKKYNRRKILSFEPGYLIYQMKKLILDVRVQLSIQVMSNVDIFLKNIQLTMIIITTTQYRLQTIRVTYLRRNVPCIWCIVLNRILKFQFFESYFFLFQKLDSQKRK